MPTEVIKLFRPVAIGSDDTWSLGKGSSKEDAVDPGLPIVHDEWATYIVEANTATRQSFRIDRNFPDKMGTITEVRVHCRYDPVLSAASEVRVVVALQATPVWIESADLSHGGADWGDVSAALARPGGGGWTEADLRDATFQYGIRLGTNNFWLYVTSLWLAITYVPTDEGAGAIPPEFPSRRLRRGRLPVPILTATMRGDAIDLDLMEDFEVIHSEGPHPDGEGWKDERWQRRRFRLLENVLDPNEMTVKIRAIDLHDYAAMFWHTGISPYNYKSDEAFPDGPAILHPGSIETFTRTGYAHILNASNIVVELNSEIKRIGPDGILLEGSATNHIVNSSFFNGTTGWSFGGVGGTTTLDPNNTLFADDIIDRLGGTNQSLKIADVAGAGAWARRVTSQTFNNQELVALSLWHRDSSTNPGWWAAENVTTGNWYNASTQTWGGFVTNPLSSFASGIWERDVFVFLNDTSTSTLAVQIHSPSSGGNDYIHLAHTQLEWKPDGQQAATSPIPTFTSAITRNAETLKFSNDVGRRIWPVKRGTLIVRLKWFFDGPISSVATPPSDTDVWGLPIFLCWHDSDNWAYLEYYITEQIWFIIKAGGTKKIAKLTSFSPSNEDMNVFAARWTSESGGELELPSRNISVFVDGVKGSVEDQQTADMTEVDSGSETFWGPGKSGFGGWTLVPEPSAAYSHVEILPWCLTDEEIRARP